MSAKDPIDAYPAAGRLLALLSFAAYILFTILPNSHSLMVQWSWVLVWWVGLICAILWLIARLLVTKRLHRLGFGGDWLVGVGLLGLLISTLFAEFPAQARWYAGSTLGYIAALYGVRDWARIGSRRRDLLTKVGAIAVAVILVSLGLWTFQTLLPELTRLETLKQAGVTIPFDFSVVQLRNWVPMGHQNYVAGYLLLVIPLLIGLSLIAEGTKVWIWRISTFLGLIALYTTSSRGGWLGLAVLAGYAIALLLWKKVIPRLWILLGGLGLIGVVLGLGLANNRLRNIFFALLQGKFEGGELLYRTINGAIGWRMGISHLFTGIGLGNAPLQYQRFRPVWAGRESEWIYQLHSTPAQLWAELGIWGLMLLLGSLTVGIILTVRYVRSLKNHKRSRRTNPDEILFWSLLGGLIAYGAMALTDFQLDNVAISGTLVIYWACLSAIASDAVFSEPERAKRELAAPWSVRLGYGLVAIVFILLVGLIPTLRAWQLSSVGFAALQQKKVDSFVNYLSQSQKIAPWQPYYGYQLGWNLGDIAFKLPQTNEKATLMPQSIEALQAGIKASPYQEFGYTNLGWLQLDRDPQAAAIAFAQAAQLLPAKPKLFLGLGLALLEQDREKEAFDAFSLEILRNPIVITSPYWQLFPNLRSRYPAILQAAIDRCTALLQQPDLNPTLKAHLQQVRGGIHWWLGNYPDAQIDWQQAGTPLSRAVLALSQGQSLSEPLAPPTSLVIDAWKNPQGRSQDLTQAWILATRSPIPPDLASQLVVSMEQSANFGDWLRKNAPFEQYRSLRSGFNVLSRQMDGSIPQDFLVEIDNVPMVTWFAELLPSPVSDRALDLALQPMREDLLRSVLAESK
jgi:uncharacterized protein involved in response to NO